jgi:hypothetical protein
VVHPLDVGALTVTLRAVSAPISLTVPVAVRHWPTSNAAEVAGTVSLIWVDLFSSNLMLVRAGGLADLELVARLLAEIRRPWSSIASADLAVWKSCGAARSYPGRLGEHPSLRHRLEKCARPTPAP